jgi:hypothetical protein
MGAGRVLDQQVDVAERAQSGVWVPGRHDRALHRDHVTVVGGTDAIEHERHDERSDCGAPLALDQFRGHGPAQRAPAPDREQVQLVADEILHRRRSIDQTVDCWPEFACLALLQRVAVLPRGADGGSRHQ